MNKARKVEIDKALKALDDVRDKLYNILEDEQEYFDQMPESIASGEKGDQAQEALESLQLAIEQVDGALEALEDARSCNPR